MKDPSTRRPVERLGPRQGPNRAWVEAIADGIEREIAETGEPFVVRFPFPLGEAQERLVRALGVTVGLVDLDLERAERLRRAG